MIGEEKGDETVMWKQKRSGLENKIEKKKKLVLKKMKTKVNKEDGENNDEKIKEEFLNWFLKQDKRKLMATNYQLLH